MEEVKKRVLFWFRRDLRLEDNVGLYNALKNSDIVAPIFIFDKEILDSLPSQDKRLVFIWQAIKSLREQLRELGSDLIVRYSYAKTEIPLLAKKFKVEAVYCNEDYEPQARHRDNSIKEILNKNGIDFISFKDSVIFSKKELLDNQGQVFTSFTSYKKAWEKELSKEDYQLVDILSYKHRLSQFKIKDEILLEDFGFKNIQTNKLEISNDGAKKIFEKFKGKMLPHYKTLRDFPSISGVSYLSTYNRFGLISIRYLVAQIKALITVSDKERATNAQAWLDELIWREFYMQLLFNYPRVAYEPFRPEYKYLNWDNNFYYFQLWCEGKTGYPIVDAAMKQLNDTGYMHNRLRMIVSSFLCKTLLIDYRVGEEYFALKLLDFDLSANNGGWQWAASTGVDNVNYIRIFNPTKQSERYDAEARFIKKQLPILKNVPAKYLHEPWIYEEELKEYGVILGKNYPRPIVNYEEKRKEALKMYEEINKLN